MLQLKEEQLSIYKEDFDFRKTAHKEHTEVLLSLIGKVDELTNTIRSFGPQYLE